MRPILLALALLALLAPAAQGASRNQIIRDCADDGRLDRDYTASELRDARKNLPADVDEYTDCRDVLRRAELAASASAGGSGGSGGTPAGAASTTPGAPPPGGFTAHTAQEQQALAAARKDAGGAVEVAGREIAPGASGFAAHAARHDLPWPLIAVLVLLGAAALAAAAPAVLKRVRLRRAQAA